MNWAAMLAGLGGRRFAVTLGCGAVTSLLQWFGHLDAAGNTYAIVTVATVGAYIGANTAQKHAELKAGQEPTP